MSRTGVNRTYLEIVRLQLHERLVYPLDLLGSWVSLPLTLIIYFVIYGHIFELKPDFAGTTFPALLAYLSTALVFRKLSDALGESNDVQEEIKNGDFFVYLTRPLNYFWVRVSRQFAKFLSKAVVGIPLLYAFIYYLTGNWTPLERFIPGIVLATIGAFAIFQLYYCIGLLAFWFEEVWGFRRMIFSISWLFSGSMIPISLLPKEIQFISFLIPFQHQAAVPAQFIVGQIGWNTYGQSLLVLLIWIAILGVIQSMLWKKGLLKHDGKG